MKKKFEKRRCQRFSIPGACVRYQKGGSWKLISRLSDCKELINISKGGLCFRDEDRNRIGDKVTVSLFLPHGGCLQIRGAVAWEDGNDFSGYFVGVKFAAFASGFGNNSQDILNTLRTLEAHYLNDDGELSRVA